MSSKVNKIGIGTHSYIQTPLFDRYFKIEETI